MTRGIKFLMAVAIGLGVSCCRNVLSETARKPLSAYPCQFGAAPQRRRRDLDLLEAVGASLQDACSACGLGACLDAAHGIGFSAGLLVR